MFDRGNEMKKEMDNAMMEKVNGGVMGEGNREIGTPGPGGVYTGYLHRYCGGYVNMKHKYGALGGDIIFKCERCNLMCNDIRGYLKDDHGYCE